MKKEKKEKKPKKIKNKPEKEREKREKRPKFKLPVKAKAKGKANKPADSDSFGAMVHSSEPIMRLKEDGKKAPWKQDLVLNLSCAALVTSAIALFCMSIEEPLLIPFALTCPVVFMAVTFIRTLKKKELVWTAQLVMLLLFVAAVAIWSSTIMGGLSMLINRFYDVAEQAQAYIYERPSGGYDATETSARIAIAWVSGLAGFITAMPPARFRRAVSALVTIAIMIALAYYGLLPSAICIAVMIAALIIALSRGTLISFLPVVLAALVLFGAIVLIDPGESYTVSRVDESLRDRFAISSTLLQSDSSFYEEEDQSYQDDEESFEGEEYENEEEGEYGIYVIYGSIALLVAALGAIVFLLYRRIKRKRAENRRGLNSSDTREAVTAMFPYAVRWLKGYGIEQTGPSFTSMMPALMNEFSDTYVHRFREMYLLWSEAAYSDHDVTENTRVLMNAFMKDTVKMVDDKCKLKDKLRLKFRYAL